MRLVRTISIAMGLFAAALACGDSTDTDASSKSGEPGSSGAPGSSGDPGASSGMPGSSGTPGGTATVTVTGISPAFAFATGGTDVTITGTSFAAGATVMLGSSPCVGPNVISATEIRCKTPAASAARVSVTVSNAGGAMGSLADAFEFRGFLHVASQNGGVTTFRHDLATGALASTGTGSIGGFPKTLRVTNAGRFLYASTGSPNQISLVTNDPATGVPTAAGAPFPMPLSGLPYLFLFDPLGTYAWVTVFGPSLSAFTVNPTSGALTAVPMGSITPNGGGATCAITPNGKFIFASAATNTMSGFSVDRSTGKLTALSQTVSIGAPQAMALHPNGKFLYVGTGSGSVAAKAIDATSGALSDIASPVTAADNTHDLLLARGGKFLFSVNINPPASVKGFSIDQTTGALTPMASSTMITSANAGAVDPGGTFLYVTQVPGNKLNVFRIGEDGSLTAIGAAIDIANGTPLVPIAF